MNIADHIQHQIDERSKNNLIRQVSCPSAGVLDFASNDYLGLAGRPLSNGFAGGSGASTLVNGYSPAQQALEEALAEYLQVDAVMVMASGYQTNIGVLQALLTGDHHAVIDKRAHASIIDGLRLSGCQWRRYRHLDHDHLASLANVDIAISEGLFSMDGDWLNVPEFLAAAKPAWSFIDDAHGLMLRPVNLTGVDVYMATFSKALGCLGGLVAGSQQLIDYLRQCSRAQVFSTALPPALLTHIHQNFELACRGDRQAKLAANIHLWQSLTASRFDGPIQIIEQPSNEQLLTNHAKLLQAGYGVGAIRRPSVATPRLRITLSEKHTPEQIKGLAEQIINLC